MHCTWLAGSLVAVGVAITRDESASEIYYVPREGEDMSRAEVIAPVLQTLLSADRAHGLTLDGIMFEHSTWRLEGQGYGYTPCRRDGTTPQGHYRPDSPGPVTRLTRNQTAPT
jgi:hypothetical protein